MKRPVRLRIGLACLVTLACPTYLLYAGQPTASALSVLRQSATSGDVRAQVSLGIVHRNGDGVSRDDRAAAHWFQLAAARGDCTAQFELGAMYQLGLGGLPKDDLRAIDLYIRSARQGFASASLVLGVDYELGDGVPRSRSQAIGLFQQAGDDGAFIANVLAAAATPARFDSARALGDYLAQTRNTSFAAFWTDPAARIRRAGERATLTGVLRSR